MSAVCNMNIIGYFWKKRKLYQSFVSPFVSFGFLLLLAGALASSTSLSFCFLLDPGATFGTTGGFLGPESPRPLALPRPLPLEAPLPLAAAGRFIAGLFLVARSEDRSEESSPLSSSLHPAAFLNIFCAWTSSRIWRLEFGMVISMYIMHHTCFHICIRPASK